MHAPRLARALLSLLLLAAAPAVQGAEPQKLPNYIPVCKASDPNLDECLKKATQVAIDKLRGGIPNMNVLPLDPLEVSLIEIGQGQGAISINIKFTNITVTGLSDAQVHKCKADLKNYKLVYEGSIADAMLVADYEMSGRILLLPVTGKGRSNLKFKNIQAVLGPSGKGKVKKGKSYFDVDKFSLDINGLDNLHVQFENLFNGDKTLGETMNRLMNEHWQELWGELKPAFDASFGAIFHQYSKSIFDKVPFNDIFLE